MLHFVFCFGVWTLVISWLITQIIQRMAQSINHVQKLHQIPCANCVYFTGNYSLKCTLHPLKAMSEEAICCCDFEVKSDYTNNNFKIYSNNQLSKSN